MTTHTEALPIPNTPERPTTAGVDAPPLVHLRASGVSVLLDLRERTLPSILHWGADLGDLDDATLDLLARATTELIAGSNPDVPVVPSLLPEQALGWTGTPGLVGHRDGIDFAPLFTISSARVESHPPIGSDSDAEADAGVDGGARLVVTAVDDAISLELFIEVELTASGLLRTRATLTNHGERYTVDALTPQLPVPMEAAEILDFAGRHTRERSPQRRAFTMGTHLREGRHGRTGLDATLLIAAGSAGFGFRSGAVWAVHTAWSGNHRTFAERTHLGSAVLGGGELLLAGEVQLETGQQYTSPWLYGSYGVGLDAVSARFHQWMRARARHPRSARPVVLNTWEAVYFDQDLPTLTRLADAAAGVGVERFVLDDGWFLGRHHDRAGLGDWVVDPMTWPEGLGRGCSSGCGSNPRW
jgi:alpha-galactosidase